MIGRADPGRRADARMIEFHCWTGLLSDWLLKTSTLKLAWYKSGGHWS